MHNYKFYDTIKQAIDCNIAHEPTEVTVRDLEELYLKLSLNLQEVKSEIYKWFVSIIIAQTAAIAAVVSFLHNQ